MNLNDSDLPLIIIIIQIRCHNENIIKLQY